MSREREAKQKDQQRKKKKLNTKLLSFGEDGESDVKENGDVHAARITSVFEADVDNPRSISDSRTKALGSCQAKFLQTETQTFASMSVGCKYSRRCALDKRKGRIVIDMRCCSIVGL